ncbi:site-2 protease family protein [Candidatus Woesearchaeota archaeon]|nr:site-2 protease family protein [Candidatus Woesearchaeota archaeon]
MFFQDHLGTIVFYAVIIILLIANRKKFDRQAKIIFMYRTQIGIKFMERFVRPKRKSVDDFGKWLFNISTVVVLLTGIPLVMRSIFEGILGMPLPDAIQLSSAATLVFIKIFSAAFIVFLISIIFFKQIRRAGAIGIYVGYFGMALIVVTLIKGLIDTFLIPNAPPALQPVIPGVSLPGSTFHVPLISGWLALFFVIVVHEFSHGIVSKAHNLPVKSSGIVFFGPLMGAFVEPEEQKLVKANPKVQNSIYAAGPFSNVLLTIFVAILFLFVLPPMNSPIMGEPTGWKITEVEEGSPAYLAGIEEGTIFTGLNGRTVLTSNQFLVEVQNITIGENIVMSTPTEDYTVVVAEHPDDPDKPYIGIKWDPGTVDQRSKQDTIGAKVFVWVLQLLTLIFLLSLGIGLANLLPIGPVDGGRMFNIATQKWWGKQKGRVIFTKVSIIVFLIIIFLLIWPIIRGLFTLGV